MINLETVKRWALEEINKESEGESFIYKNSERGGDGVVCEYVEMDLDSKSRYVPSCLIGRMFLNNNVVSVEDLLEGDNNNLAVSNLVQELDIEVEENAKLFLLTLQYRQDDGYTWGLAYEKAADMAEAEADRY